MQALRRSGCWGDNSIPIVLLDNNENYTFTGIKWSFFWRFAPWHWKLEGTKKKTQLSNIVENNESRDGISLYHLAINQLFETLVFIQIFRKSL